MSKFIVETDLGHDPDDLFCICHLVEAGHEITAIGLVPGSPEQVALAHGLRTHLSIPCEIGVAKPNAKSEHLGMHTQLMKAHGWTKGEHDGESKDVFTRALAGRDRPDILVIGPAPGLGKNSSSLSGCRLTFQGGFLPYAIHYPTHPLAKFFDKRSAPTFNMNGDRGAVGAILHAPLTLRRFCGKNVCHAVVLDRERARTFCPPRGLAGEVYLQARELYLAKHAEKKMHDPTALACHLYPDLATWVRGRPVLDGPNWTTLLDPLGDFILADVDHDRLWEVLANRR